MGSLRVWVERGVTGTEVARLAGFRSLCSSIRAPPGGACLSYTGCPAHHPPPTFSIHCGAGLSVFCLGNNRGSNPPASSILPPGYISHGSDSPSPLPTLGPDHHGLSLAHLHQTPLFLSYTPFSGASFMKYKLDQSHPPLHKAL